MTALAPRPVRPDPSEPPARRPVVDGARRRRLRVLTVTTVAAWLVALVATSAPVLGATGTGTGLDAKPTTGPVASSTPRPTKAPATPKATSGARATATPSPAVQPTPTPTPKAHPTPKATAKPTAKPKPTPKPTATPGPAATPTPSPTPHPTSNAGGKGKGGGSGSGGSTGGAATPAPATGGGGASTGSSSGGSMGSGAVPVRPSLPPDVFAVGGVPVEVLDGPEPASGGQAAGDELEADIYLDFRDVASVSVFAPAALLALPAILIIASLVAQLAGGVLWIPLTDRVLGPRADRRRRR